MQGNESDKDWLKDAPTLAAVRKTVPFRTPGNYFEDLAEVTRIRAELEELRAYHTDGTVPSSYFDELPERIRIRIAEEELKRKVSGPGFIVPEGYFSTLSDRITSRIDGTPKRQITARPIRTWVGYAAAACISLAIGAAIYMNSASYQIHKELAGVSDDAIINYLQVHSTAGDTQFIIENLSGDEFEQLSNDLPEDELEIYLENTVL